MMALEAVRHFRYVNTQPFRETKTSMQMIQKFLKLAESNGWQKKDLTEEQKKGVSVDVMLKLLDSLDEEEEKPRKIIDIELNQDAEKLN